MSADLPASMAPPTGQALPPPPLLPPTTLPVPLPPLPNSVSNADSSGASRRATLVVAVAIASVMTIVGAAVGAMLAPRSASLNATSSSLPMPTSSTVLAGDSLTALIDAVGPAVVSVSSSNEQASGFVVRDDGYIVTNDHSLGSRDIVVTLVDGTELPATLVGRSPSYDIAVLKVDRRNLPVAILGDSSAVVVGDTAIAMGSPLDLPNTATAGIFSAVNRPVVSDSRGTTAVFSALQTDAPVNPGSSGGPVVNARGEVVGVITTNASLNGTGDTGSIGVAFAVPSNQVRRLVSELIGGGTASRAILGVSIDGDYVGFGCRLSAVEAGGPAEMAGLREGDVVVALGGQPVTDSLDLVARVRASQPGQTVTVSVSNGAAPPNVREVKVTLGSQPDDGD